jgi:hypothetical protein
MKKYFFTALVMTAAITLTVSADPRLQKKHSGMNKNGKAINCGYCHNQAKIEKKKGAAPIGMVNTNINCTNAGCHPIKK